jgi:hypothetical protein
MESDIITMQDIFVFDKQGVAPNGAGARRLPRDRHPPALRRPAGGERHPAPLDMFAQAPSMRREAW